MALPDLGNSGRAAGNRARQLGQSLGTKLNPKQLVAGGYDTLKGQLFSEIPELGSFVGGIENTFRDVMSDLRNRKDEEIVEESKEQNEKLKQIKDDTGQNNDTLLGLLKVMDLTLAATLEGNQERLAELRALTGITAETQNITTEQLELIRDSVRMEKKQDKQSKFTRQKENAKLPSVVPGSAADKEKSKSNNALIKFLEGSFLLRMIAGMGGIVETALMAFGGKELFDIFRGGNKPLFGGAIAGASRKNLTLNSAGKAIDGKTGQFVKQSPKNIKQARINRIRAGGKGGLIKGPGAKMAGGVFKGAKAFARGSGILTLVVVAMDALLGGFEAGVKSFREGNDAPKIVADVLTGALKGIVTGVIETVKFIIFGFLPFMKDLGVELFKNFSTFMDENVTKPAGAALRKFGKGVIDSTTKFLSGLGDSIASTWDFAKASFMDGIKGVINSIVDKTRTRKLLPDSVRSFLETPSAQPSLGQLAPTAKSATTASVMVTGQKNINDFEMEQKAMTEALMGQNIMQAPVTTTIQNNNIFSGNIHTRNPDSPVFLKQKTSF